MWNQNATIHIDNFAPHSRHLASPKKEIRTFSSNQHRCWVSMDGLLLAVTHMLASMDSLFYVVSIDSTVSLLELCEAQLNEYSLYACAYTQK